MSVWLATCLCIYLSACLFVCRSVGLPIYLSIMLYPSIYLSIHLSIYFKPRKTKQNSTLLKLGRNDSGAEMTHLPGPKRPTPKISRNDPGRNNPEPLQHPEQTIPDTTRFQRNLLLFFLKCSVHHLPHPTENLCLSRSHC